MQIVVSSLFFVTLLELLKACWYPKDVTVPAPLPLPHHLGLQNGDVLQQLVVLLDKGIDLCTESAVIRLARRKLQQVLLHVAGR